MNVRAILLRSVLALAVTLILWAARPPAPAQAAYQVLRPIANGAINQTYLYGLLSPTGSGARHTGVDFSYGTGTPVRAVAAGTVREEYHDRPNNDHNPDYLWGNYVLIRHDQRYAGQYVYSFYAHLAYNSIPFRAGDRVAAGQQIAQVDNTGVTQGAHLHFQINLYHNQWLGSWEVSTTSRNPELWLQPLTGKGTVMEVLLGDDGAPLGKPLRIMGLRKSGTNYQQCDVYWDLTRSIPDDVYQENFGTTDVDAGSATVYAEYWDDEFGVWRRYRTPWHVTVTAGQVTYIALYPAYLPDVKANYGDWVSSFVIVRNNGPRRAQVITTFLDSNGAIHDQQTDIVDARAITVKVPPGTMQGCAVVRASEDVSVMVGTDSGSRTYAYVGIPSTPSVAGVGTGTTIFVPSYFDRFYDWDSVLYVQNAGAEPTTIHADFYHADGNPVDPGYNPPPQFVLPNERATFSPSIDQGGMYSIHVWAAALSQPLAATVGHYHANLATAYACPSSGGTKGYLASLMKNFYGWDSSFVAQETTDHSATVRTYYYPPDGSGPTFSLNGRGQQTVWMGGQSQLPSTWIGAAKVSRTSGSGEMAFAVHQASATSAQAFHGAQAGARDLYVPFLQQGLHGWNTSLTVQNVETNNANVTVRFYEKTTGELIGDPYSFPLAGGHARVLYNEVPFEKISSAWVYSTRKVIAVVQMSHTNGRALSYAVP